MAFIAEQMTQEDLLSIYSPEHASQYRDLRLIGKTDHIKDNWIIDRERDLCLVHLINGEVTDRDIFLALFWKLDFVVIELESEFVSGQMNATVRFITDGIKNRVVEIQGFFNEALAIENGLFFFFADPSQTTSVKLLPMKGEK